MDTESLILLIQERESLWNQKSEYYHSRIEQRRLWNEIAEQTNLKVDEIKKKWRCLRDIFRRELKKTTCHRSGDLGEDYVPKWPHFKTLFFLSDTMTTKDLSAIVPSEVDEPEIDFVSCYPPENDSWTSSQTQIPSTSRRVFKPPSKKRSKRLRESSFDEKHFYENMADSEMQFLMSLHPFLKRVPTGRQLAVRTSIMRVLIDDETTLQIPNLKVSDDEC